MSEPYRVEKKTGSCGRPAVALSHGCVCGRAGLRDAGADVARVAALAFSVTSRLQLLARRLCLLPLSEAAFAAAAAARPKGPEELSCPPAERRTPDSWESTSGEVRHSEKEKECVRRHSNRTCITKMKVCKPINLRLYYTLPAYGVHGFPIAWRVGGALWRGEPTSGAAGKVHVSPACPRTAQSTPRVEHPTNVPYAAALIVHTLVKEQLLRMCHNTHTTLNHLTWFQVWVW